MTKLVSGTTSKKVTYFVKNETESYNITYKGQNIKVEAHPAFVVADPNSGTAVNAKDWVNSTWKTHENVLPEKGFVFEVDNSVIDGISIVGYSRRKDNIAFEVVYKINDIFILVDLTKDSLLECVWNSKIEKGESLDSFVWAIVSGKHRLIRSESEEYKGIVASQDLKPIKAKDLIVGCCYAGKGDYNDDHQVYLGTGYYVKPGDRIPSTGRYGEPYTVRHQIWGCLRHWKDNPITSLDVLFNDIPNLPWYVHPFNFETKSRTVWVSGRHLDGTINLFQKIRRAALIAQLNSFVRLREEDGELARTLTPNTKIGLVTLGETEPNFEYSCYDKPLSVEECKQLIKTL